ncbi:MAG: MBL fold metallo-hydrolase [Candidatus Kapabacteria bacterium]|nr:MBL fold metallo-hydrolase [Candidatus Kapabacteria bacterium]
MKIGRFLIDLVPTGVFALDGGAMFGVVPKALWSKAYHPADELNRIPLAAQPLLIRWEDNAVLVDTGNGSKMSDKFAEIYGIDKSKSDILQALNLYGVSPDQINTVILTHLHFDHAGGATIKADNEIIPTFPKAKYIVQKEHFKWAQSPTDKDRASFVSENYMPLKQNGLIEFSEADEELFPGISVIEVNGHTQSMQLVKITDAGQTLLYCADMCATSAHIPVPYVMGYDNSPLTTIEEKKRILTQAYEEDWLLAFEHDAFTQAAKLYRNEKGFHVGEKFEITKFI